MRLAGSIKEAPEREDARNMIRHLFGSAIVLVLTTTSGSAVEVAKSIDVAAPPAAVWKAIGDFCGIGNWHPALQSCELSKKGDKTHRTLTLKGGGTILEEQLSFDDSDMGYSYAILESPLPVTEYTAKIGVKPSGSGSTVTWTASFKAKGADDAKAQEVIGGIFDAGLAALAKSK